MIKKNPIKIIYHLNPNSNGGLYLINGFFLLDCFSIGGEVGSHPGPYQNVKILSLIPF